MTLPPLDAANFDAARQHWLAVRVYYEDTDFTGMVYHANYLRFFERGRSDHLRDAGISHQSLLAREDPAAFTLTNVNVTYRRPAKVDDLLHIRTRYLGMDGPRIRFSQACLRDVAAGKPIGETCRGESQNLKDREILEFLGDNPGSTLG